MEIFKERDETICKLWSIFRTLSDHQKDDMSNEDLDLWTEICKHSAIQSRLNIKLCTCMTKTPDPKYHKDDCPISNTGENDGD